MKNISLKDNLIKMIHILKVVHRTSKGYLYSFLSEVLLHSIQPYITIIFTYLLIDALVLGSSTKTILVYVFWMIGLNLLVGVLMKVAYYYKTYYVIELNYNLDTMLAMKSFDLDFSQIEDNDTMKLIELAKEGSNGNGGLKQYCEYILGGMLISLLSVIYGIVLLSGMVTRAVLTETTPFVLFLNSPYSSIIVLAALFIPSIFAKYIMDKDTKKSYAVMQGNIEGNRRASYYFRIAQNYKLGKDIRMFGTKDMIVEEMMDQKNSVDDNWRGYVEFNVKMMYLGYFGNFLLSVIAYTFVGLKAIYGLITLGSLVSYVASITLVSKSLSTIITRYAKMHLYNNYLDNYFTYLELDHSQDFGDVTNIDTSSLEITFDHVSFKYPNTENYVLQDLSFTIHPNEKLAIVGPNGAGKTTLVKLLCRLYDVTEGEIRINGINIKEYTKETLYNLYSIVFQDFKLFSYSIADNIAVGHDVDMDKLHTVLDEVGMTERISQMDKGTNTILYNRNSEAGVEISGGEAQKLAVARALYKDSPFVILDEPTAALDPRSEADIYEKYNRLVEDKTSIFISHRMSSTKFCDRILVIDQGTVSEMGNHKTLLSHDGLYSQMWTAQAKYYKNE